MSNSENPTSISGTPTSRQSSEKLAVMWAAGLSLGGKLWTDQWNRKNFAEVMHPILKEYSLEEVQSAMLHIQRNFVGTIPKPREMTDELRRQRRRAIPAPENVVDITHRSPPSPEALELINQGRRKRGQKPKTMADFTHPDPSDET